MNNATTPTGSSIKEVIQDIEELNISIRARLQILNKPGNTQAKGEESKFLARLYEEKCLLGEKLQDLQTELGEYIEKVNYFD
jgi:hypothetical protein